MRACVRALFVVYLFDCMCVCVYVGASTDRRGQVRSTHSERAAQPTDPSTSIDRRAIDAHQPHRRPTAPSPLYNNQVTHGPTGEALQVPFRRIHLSDEDPGCQHIDVYDTR